MYSMGTKATHRKAVVHYAAHFFSRGNLKNLMPRSFTIVCQLYCCTSKHNNNKALRITFNSCKTVSTSSMTLATVNIDKIIKVTSASSYVFSEPAIDVDAYALIKLTACLLRYLTSTLQFALRVAAHPRRSVVGSLIKQSEPSFTGSEADRVNYRRACRDASRLINGSRKDHVRSRIEATGGGWKQRSRVVDELLHSRDTDKSGTDNENCDLSKSFAEYFVRKIGKLREAALGTLRRTQADFLSTLLDLPEPPHTGQTIAAWLSGKNVGL